MSNIVVTMFTVQQFLFLCEIHVDSLMGTNQVQVACATPYKGIRRGLWEGTHLTEHGCPLAGTTGHDY